MNLLIVNLYKITLKNERFYFKNMDLALLHKK